jgi:hypothetical protein
MKDSLIYDRTVNNQGGGVRLIIQPQEGRQNLKLIVEEYDGEGNVAKFTAGTLRASELVGTIKALNYLIGTIGQETPTS